MSTDWKDIKEAFESKGFSTSESHEKLIVTYRGLITTLSKPITFNKIEYRTLAANPNKKWFSTEVVSSTEVLHKIDFTALLKELNFAADAKENRENKDKAIKFKMELYKIFLENIFDTKYFHCRIVVEGYKVTINCRLYNDYFQIIFQNKKNHDKDMIIDSKMEDYLGNIVYNGTIFKFCNINDQLKKMNEHIFIHIKNKFEQTKEFNEKIEPLNVKYQEEYNRIRLAFEKNKLDLIKQYPLMDTEMTNELVNKGIKKCLQ